MNIGILFHSCTGNTLSVAQTLAEALRAAGIPAELDRVETDPKEAEAPSFSIVHAPDPAQYDALVFACPVHGFRISRQMALYLQDLPDLKGKKTLCFVTHTFPFGFLGGTGSKKQLEAILRKKGAEVVASACIDWGSKKREAQIASLREQAVPIFHA